MFSSCVLLVIFLLRIYNALSFWILESNGICLSLFFVSVLAFLCLVKSNGSILCVLNVIFSVFVQSPEIRCLKRIWVCDDSKDWEESVKALMYCGRAEEKQWSCGKAGTVNLQRVGSMVREMGEPCLSQSPIKVSIAVRYSNQLIHLWRSVLSLLALFFYTIINSK